MKKVHFSASIFFFLVLSSCANAPEIKGFSSEQWKSDREGCKGLRVQYADLILESKDQLLGKGEQLILNLMGRPDKNELYRRQQKFYIYYIQPGPKCTAQPAQTDSAKYLSLKFNATGIVNEVFIYN